MSVLKLRSGVWEKMNACASVKRVRDLDFILLYEQVGAAIDAPSAFRLIGPMWWEINR